MKNLLRNSLLVLAAVAMLSANAVAQPVLVKPPWADTLNLWVMDNGLGSQKAVRKLVKKFQRDTEIPVNVRVLDWGSAYAEITKAFANPDSTPDYPDILQLGSTWVPQFASVGWLRDLDTLLVQIDSSRFYQEAYKAGHIAGKSTVYSFPWFLDVRAFFANEWLWHTLNIQDTDVNSYSRFIGALRAIHRGELKNTEMKRVAAFALPGKNDWTGPQQMAPFIWSFGGDFLKCDQGKCRSALLDSATLDGIDIFAKILGDEELAPYSLQENSAQNAVRFVNSELLIHYGTSELIRQLEYPEDAGGLRSSAIADDGIMILGSQELPQFRSTFVGGSHLALASNKDATKFAAAEKLLTYMMRADNVDAYCRAVGFLPSDRGLIGIWNQDRRYSQLIQGLERGKSFPNIPEWGQIEGVLIQLSNDMGTALSEAEDKNARVEKLAKLVVEAHFRVNEILGATEPKEKPELLQWVQNVFATDIQEIEPEELRFEPLPSPIPLWRIIDFVVVAVIALIIVAVPVTLIVYLVRRKK